MIRYSVQIQQYSLFYFKFHLKSTHIRNSWGWDRHSIKQKNPKHCPVACMLKGPATYTSRSIIVYWWRQNDNHSPGPWPCSSDSRKRSELSNSILGTCSRGDKRVWKYIPVSNGLEEKATLKNISITISNACTKFYSRKIHVKITTVISQVTPIVVSHIR